MNNRIIRDKIELNEHTHGIYGLGNIDYTFSVINNIVSLTIRIEANKSTVVINGEKARDLYNQIIADSDDNIIRRIAVIASNSLYITLSSLYKKSRQPKIVFAKYCIYWFVQTYLNYSQESASHIFNQDRLTARRAVIEFEEITKKNDPERYEWKERFKKNLETQASDLLKFKKIERETTV